MIQFSEIRFFVGGPRGVLDSRRLHPSFIQSYRINKESGNKPTVTLMFKNKILEHGPETISLEEFNERVKPYVK